MKIINEERFDEERALYNASDIKLNDCMSSVENSTLRSYHSIKNR